MGNIGYKAGKWISSHPKISILIVAACVTLWALDQYRVWRIKNTIQTEISANNARYEAIANKNADWTLIYASYGLQTDAKGQFPEKNYYLDKNSIKKLDDENLRKAFFKTPGSLGGALDRNEVTYYSISEFEVNCQSNTIRKNLEISIKQDSEHAENKVNQKTGETTNIIVPKKLTVMSVSDKSGSWIPGNSFEDKGIIGALCDPNYTLIDTRNPYWQKPKS